ncbi:hypothetical protein F4777DRAFT_414883 [Nemania sp. FL0916]|nr:hypothetical protein F4777DRAFT_414883 [Nemania sp. FL0916]
MQFKAVAIALFLAATASAAPVATKGQDYPLPLPDTVNESFKDITTETNQAIGNGIAGHNGNGNGNGNAIASGNPILTGNKLPIADGNKLPIAAGNALPIATGNKVLSGDNKVIDDNAVLNDLVNVKLGSSSHKIAQDVVEAMKSLTMTCSSDSEGAMSCKWTS